MLLCDETLVSVNVYSIFFMLDTLLSDFVCVYADDFGLHKTSLSKHFLVKVLMLIWLARASIIQGYAVCKPYIIFLQNLMKFVFWRTSRTWYIISRHLIYSSYFRSYIEPICVYLKSLIILNPKHQVDLTIWVPWNSIIKRVENIGQTLVIQLLHNIASVLHLISSFVHLYMCLRMRMCVYL